jgi:hypothetical protein
MKEIILGFIEATLMLIVSIIAIAIRLARRMWLKVSRFILKRYFNIETRAYLKWHSRRVAKIQAALDIEHSAYPSF